MAKKHRTKASIEGMPSAPPTETQDRPDDGEPRRDRIMTDHAPLITKEQQDAMIRRYHHLVNLMFSTGLTEAESAEMERLGQEIDHFHDDFYESVLANVRAHLKGRNTSR